MCLNGCMAKQSHTVGDGQTPIAEHFASDGGARSPQRAPPANRRGRVVPSAGSADILVGGCWRLSSRQFLRTEYRAARESGTEKSRAPRPRRLESLRYDVWPPRAWERPFPPPPKKSNESRQIVPNRGKSHPIVVNPPLPSGRTNSARFPHLSRQLVAPACPAIAKRRRKQGEGGPKSESVRVSQTFEDFSTKVGVSRNQ